jgi:hypothetical protein
LLLQIGLLVLVFGDLRLRLTASKRTKWQPNADVSANPNNLSEIDYVRQLRLLLLEHRLLFVANVQELVLQVLERCVLLLRDPLYREFRPTKRTT